MRRATAAGLSLIEVLLALSLAMTAAGAAVPAMIEVSRAMQLRSGCAFVAGYLQRARLEAIRRSANVGVRFRDIGADWTLATYADTNGNGIRAADILSGEDVVVDGEIALGARSPSIRLARLSHVPDINGVAGGAAVRFGAAAIASFSADGSASSGSAYLTDGRTQVAVTVTPATGRVRVRQWLPRQGQWSQIR